MAGAVGAIGGATAIGGGLLATGGAMKVGKGVASSALSNVGLAIGSYGAVDPSTGGTQSRMQKVASALGTKMYTTGQKMSKRNTSTNGFSASDAFINAGASSINSAVKKVIPRASYNTSYYRRRNNMI